MKGKITKMDGTVVQISDDVKEGDSVVQVLEKSGQKGLDTDFFFKVVNPEKEGYEVVSDKDKNKPTFKLGDELQAVPKVVGGI